MTKREYYRRLGDYILQKSWHISDTVASVAALIIPPLVHWLYPGDPTGGARVTELAWQIPIFVLAGLTLVRGFLAPYWLYQEREHEVESLKNAHQQTEDNLRQQIATFKDQLDTRTQLHEQRLHNRAVLQAHCDAIADFVEEGKRIQGLYVKGEAFMTIDEVEIWFCEVHTYLEENLGRAVVSQWKNDDGLFIPESPQNYLRMVRVLKPGEVVRPAFTLHARRTQVYQTLTFRLKRLYELLTKLQDRLLNE